ncbi:hypothetical protein BDZ89DRAFT_1066083 [Hymenopellis radicata]|nr:hypothetical protein BDZ89DRAFT_1066083 [Hymenopellis radicata]
MIIIDEPAKVQDAIDNVHRPLWQGSRSDTHLRGGPPPPAYGAVPQYIVSPPIQNRPPPRPAVGRPLPQRPGRRKSVKRRRSLKRRFCKAFSVALFIWVLVLVVWKSVKELFVDEDVRLSDSDFPVMGDVSLSDCVRGRGWLNELDALDGHKRFDIPLNVSKIRVFARGDLPSGFIGLRTSSAVTDAVRVEVALPYHHLDVLERARVCYVRHGDEHGVGLFTPRSWRGRKDKDTSPPFRITVTFPQDDSLTIKSFSTDLPNYVHEALDLEYVYFENLSLRGTNLPINIDAIHFGRGIIETSNSPIQIQALNSNNATVVTTNMPIYGYFNVSDSLQLQTSNAPIKVDVDMGQSSSNGKSILSMATSNNMLIANTTVFSMTGDISAVSSNGPLSVKIPEAPIDSTLRVYARTSNSPVELDLPSSYEGTVELATSNVRPVVTLSDDLDDPAGKGRTRELVGSIFWSEENAGRGRVVGKTSNSPIWLLG